MVSAEQYRTEEPRAVVILEAKCFAPSAMFTAEWEDIPKKFQAVYSENNIPCEGGGVAGEWCAKCPFGSLDEE